MTTATAHAPLCAAADPAPRAPRFEVPPGACDAHLHVFGPESRYPYQFERAYTPPDAPPPAMAHLHAALGIERAVLVQASVHGTDNRSILDAVALDPARRRAVVSVSGRETDAELSRLNGLGVRGIRVNLVDRGGMPFASLAELERMAERIAPLGWHVEFLVHVEEGSAFPDLVRRLATPAVVGHLGYTKAVKGVGDAGYQRFLRLLDEGKCWVKLSGPYRISAEDAPPYSDLDAFAAALAEAAPDRLLWGSDWPHVMQVKPMPNDGDLLDLLGRWFPDAQLRRRVLVDNPAELYGFA
jgi:2-pyrone-4,6-dicarboxylate lactonase